MILENTQNIKPEGNLVMIVYGKGGVGKTTFAASAPRPLILDFENGTKYLGERGINVNVVRLKEWFSQQDIQKLAQMLGNYDTVVIDPLGEAMDKLIDSPYIKGKQYRQADGSLTMSGWGEVKRQMRTFIKWLRDSGKHVVIVSHVNEVKTEQGLEKRIQVATGLSDEIPNMVDVISYLGVQKKADSEEYVRSLYTPAQGGLFDSKDRTGRVPAIVDIGEFTGWADLMTAMGATAMAPPQHTPVVPQPVAQAPATPAVAPPPQAPPSLMITKEQSVEMTGLAGMMVADPASQSWLLRKANSQITYQEAQTIINRARASLGV